MMLCFRVTAQIGNTQTELKKLAEENPELKDAYVAKQRRLKVSKVSKVPNKQNCSFVIYSGGCTLQEPRCLTKPNHRN